MKSYPAINKFMYHPLTYDIKRFKDSDLQTRLNEATRRYYAASSLGYTEACEQLILLIEELKAEQMDRLIQHQVKQKTLLPLDKLIRRD